MKPHPRIRKTIKWGGAAVMVLLVVAWIGTGWWGIHWGSGKASQMDVRLGSVNVVYEIGRPTAPRSTPGWWVGRLPGGMPFAISWGFSREVYWYDLPSPQPPQAPIDPVFLLGLPGATPPRSPAVSPPTQRTYEYEFELALWPLPTASLCVTLVAWYLGFLARRRARLNLCVKCHYDRTGIPSNAVCPECGAAPAAPSAS